MKFRLNVKNLGVPKWKRYWSWVWPVEIMKVYGEMEVNMSIKLYRGRVLLEAQDVIYSFEDFYEPAREFIKKKGQELLLCPPGKVLILGGGFLSFPLIMCNFFEKNGVESPQFVAVEKDRVIIWLAQTMMPANLDTKIRWVHEDAEHFLYATSEKYDVVICDVFVNDMIPSSLKTEKLLLKMRDILSASGLLVFNHLGRNPKEIEEARHFSRTTINPLFLNVECILAKTNVLIVARKAG